MKLVQIDPQTIEWEEQKWVWNTRSVTLKKILEANGYTPAQIKKISKEKRLLLSAKGLAAKLRKKDISIYILEDEEWDKPEPEPVPLKVPKPKKPPKHKPKISTGRYQGIIDDEG
jgi:hypothetical protein